MTFRGQIFTQAPLVHYSGHTWRPTYTYCIQIGRKGLKIAMDGSPYNDLSLLRKERQITEYEVI